MLYVEFFLIGLTLFDIRYLQRPKIVIPKILFEAKLRSENFNNLVRIHFLYHIIFYSYLFNNLAFFFS